MDSDRHHSRFRNRDRIHDNEICVHPSPLSLRTDTADLHATTTDAIGWWLRMGWRRPRRSPPFFLLTAPAGAAAVEALVAGAVANHDRAAVGARRRVLLAHETDLDRARIGWCRLYRRGRRSRRGRNLDDLVAADDADVFLLRSAQELRGQPAEDVVGDRLRDRDFGVLGESRGLEAGVRELLHQHFQWNAILQRQRDAGREGIHQSGDGAAFLGHHQENLARRAVLVDTDRDVALVALDVELVGDRATLVQQLATHGTRRLPGCL